MKDLGLTRNAAASPRMLHDLDSDLAVSNEPPGIEVEVPPNPRLVAMMEREGVGAEKFRVLAARLQYFRKQRQLKKVVITSTIKGEGKSVVSANLAVTLARRQRTLLIDGDLRQSGLSELLTTHGLPGITDWWQECERVPFMVLACRRSYGAATGDFAIATNVGDAHPGRRMVRMGDHRFTPAGASGRSKSLGDAG